MTTLRDGSPVSRLGSGGVGQPVRDPLWKDIAGLCLLCGLTFPTLTAYDAHIAGNQHVENEVFARDAIVLVKP